MATRKSSCNCGQLSVTYDGPDPARISLCQCYDCQRRTGSVFSVQARLPIEHVTVEGRSTTWTVPSDSSKPASRCDSMGARITSALSAVRPCTGRFPTLQTSSVLRSAASPTRRFRRR